MGVLNITPDSFFDGGRYMTPEAALGRASVMIDEGAAIIDVGGASSRPKGSTYGEGAGTVSVEEEIDRVVPVIHLISRRFPNVWISIDTFSAEVAEAAVEAGATMINDITGLRLDGRSAEIAAAHNLPLVLMHSVGDPGGMPHATAHDDVVLEVKKSLTASVERARSFGADQLIIDPGFGFGKTPRDNLRLIANLDVFTEMEIPLLVGISRKSTIGILLGGADVPTRVEDRLFGSLGVTAIAAFKGASIVRTHDVRPTVEFLKLMAATLGS